MILHGLYAGSLGRGRPLRDRPRSALRAAGLLIGLLTAFRPCVGATITVSGVVRGPEGAAVAGVAVDAIESNQTSWSSSFSDSAGFYSVAVDAGFITLNIRPPLATRLGLRYIHLGQRDSSFTFDIDLHAGHLVSGTVRGPEGAPRDNVCLDFNPITYTLPAGESVEVCTWNGGRFELVARSGAYFITSREHPGLFPLRQFVDLSSRDAPGLELSLPASPEPLYPTAPPVASRISVGEPNELGETSVVGTAGAALPYSWVLVVNQRSTHQDRVVANGDGSFQARLFAPPGSPLLIKHGYPDARWDGVDSGASTNLTAYPGTTAHVDVGGSETPGRASFAVVGAFDVNADDDASTRNWVGAAWTYRGALEVSTPGAATVVTTARSSGPPSCSAGDALHVSGDFTLYSPAIDEAFDPAQVSGEIMVELLQQNDVTGRPVVTRNYFMSSMLTPSGFPVQIRVYPAVSLRHYVRLSSFTKASLHALRHDVTFDIDVPEDLPSGVYRPLLTVNLAGVPSSQHWVAAYVTTDVDRREVTLPPVRVEGGSGPPAPPRVIWQLLIDRSVLGTRGTGAAEDAGTFGFTSQIVTQGAPYVVPPADTVIGRPIVYRLEPALPMISWADRRLPFAPQIPFRLPGGWLEVTVTTPSGERQTLGRKMFQQSWSQSPMTRSGRDPNPSAEVLQDVYVLTTLDDTFEHVFKEYGRHVIEMQGEVEDVWGTVYRGGGTYELWVAYPLDIDPGVLPFTPLAAGQALNPAVALSPGVPADIELTVTHYPGSDPARKQVETIRGRAGSHGAFTFRGAPIQLDTPGEFRVELKASYTTPDGTLYMGALTWGNVVMTPPEETRLVAHGRRGHDGLENVGPLWFIAGREFPIIPSLHVLNPYKAGDVIWSNMDALLLASSVQDPSGTIEPAILARLPRFDWRGHVQSPGTMQERIAAGELPLFVSTRTGRSPVIFPQEIDQVAYAYCASQRPDVRVREAIGIEGCGGYWRFDTTYDMQPSVGWAGDLPNDFKFQYLGVVFRDLDSGHTEYLGQGTGWVHLPFEVGNSIRLMPPFAGPGNGGWTTDGGPLMTLKSKDIDMFIYPTGARPGAVLEVGDTFHFAGHMLPALPSQVEAEVTAPSGKLRSHRGQANPVGYFYDPAGDFILDEPGAWRVKVRVWHNGTCSGGQTMPPYPSGDVLGSEDGEFVVYVVPKEAKDLDVVTPRPGILSFHNGVEPLKISGLLPEGFTSGVLDSTISIPGFILAHQRAEVSGGSYQIDLDPVTLNRDFPNLDLVGTDDENAGLSDTINVGLLFEGEKDGARLYFANTVTFQGREVFVSDLLRRRLPRATRRLYGR